MTTWRNPGRGRENPRKTFLALRGVSALLVLALALSGCNWELGVYRTLAETQVGYEAYWRTIVTLHEQHVADEAYYAKAEAIANRIYALGQNTTALMVSYKKIQDPAVKSKIDAAIQELPQLVASLVAIVNTIAPQGKNPAPANAPAVLGQTRWLLDCVEADLGEVEALR